MRPLIEEVATVLAPELLGEKVAQIPGTVFLWSSLVDATRGRYSLVATRPFRIFSSFGSRIVLTSGGDTTEQYGNPWHILDQLMSRYEVLDEVDFPFPLGGCFGFWGYDLKNFVEPKLKRSATNDLELPDCWVGFYSSLVVFDHWLGKTWIIATGLSADGSRDPGRAEGEFAFWKGLLCDPAARVEGSTRLTASPLTPRSSVSAKEFVDMVRGAQDYIHRGHIYQVNLCRRLEAEWSHSGWDLFSALAEVSPAPFAAYLHTPEFELCSSSPEMFLRMSGTHIQTRPIKGTRPRGADPTRDAQLAYELQTCPKELSELLMITDLLRNDLGRFCEYGSIHVRDLFRLERYAQVQHLVSTIEGRLRPQTTHFSAFSSCFPGGSISGAPKIRAMEIIDELERVTRGPYTGALGYLGFNRETQLSIIIRTAIYLNGRAFFHTGAGIVADSNPESEYDETQAKAAGFLEALKAGGTAALDKPVRISGASHPS